MIAVLDARTGLLLRPGDLIPYSGTRRLVAVRPRLLATTFVVRDEIRGSSVEFDGPIWYWHSQPVPLRDVHYQPHRWPWRIAVLPT